MPPWDPSAQRAAPGPKSRIDNRSAARPREKMARPPTLTPHRVREARRRLAADPKFSRLLQRVGSFRLKPRDFRDPYHDLFRAIVFQSVSTKAARTIHERLLGFVGHESGPEGVLAKTREELRQAGLSYAKADALLDLAARTRDGLVPTRRQVHHISDDDLIERLTQIRGIGRWTVEMLLIFGLGRVDVLPVDDLGVRRGYQLAFGKKREPTRAELRRVGEAWAPYRTVASWYLWRATELEW